MNINKLTLSILAGLAFSANATQAPELGRKPNLQSTNYVQNTYEKNTASNPQVSAYVSNWGQYDRKFNIGNVAHGYDKIILSFFGLCGTEIGDPAITSAVESLKNICPAAGAKEHEVISTDLWADIATTAGGALTSADQAAAGNPHWETIPSLAQRWYQGENRVAGVLGYAKKAKAENPNLQVAFSIGGWSLSEPFSRMAKDPAARKIFVDSVVQIVRNYSFFSQVDIDWEYPGGGGAEANGADPSDGDNYALLIQELRSALDSANKQTVKIAIAAGAPKTKLDASNLKILTENGVDIIHLMTYDFFGTGWAEEIAHHTNLLTYKSDGYSSEASIDYMIDVLGIDASVIHIGYAAYSRNGKNAVLDSYSPLSGSYDKDATEVPGSYENGTSEWYDLSANMMDVTEQSGIQFKDPAYKLYTDKIANADFIYNADNGLFMSLDTPRTVYAKAQYAKERGLGGIFTWMADYGDGLLLNAAREGLGQSVVAGKELIDMQNIIFQCGENVATQEECNRLTNQAEDIGVVTQANAGTDVTTQLDLNTRYSLDGSKSTSKAGELTYKWSKGKFTGVEKSMVQLIKGRTANAQFKFKDGAKPDLRGVNLTFKLTVTDTEGHVSEDTVVYLLEGENSAPISIAKSNKRSVEHGAVFNLLGRDSYDNDGDALTYKWTQLEGEPVELGTGKRKNITKIATTTLSNQEQVLKFALEVSDGFASDKSEVQVTISPSVAENIAPQAVFDALGEKVVRNTITLDAKKSSDDGSIVAHAWSVSFEGNSVTVLNADKPEAKFTPTQVGNYHVSLEVTDNLGATGQIEQTLVIEDAEQTTWVAGKVYTAGDTVMFNGYEYIANWYTTAQPGTDTSWTMKRLPGQAAPAWNSSMSYGSGAEVTHNGKTWYAAWAPAFGAEPGADAYNGWKVK
ncbi:MULTISPECIES: glycosyl hydrolase family 18 protein [Vibrio]|uniref:glycosyl hydrolase family 18 protein n=1 Tax=Vibrio TaxID=662 RepID=UPI000C829716|nr:MULTISPECIES: glycosyl hydrolase family 18 protein [Vibrio]